MHTFVSSIALGLGGLSFAFGQAPALTDADLLEKVVERQAVPAEVLAGAVTAVQQVGDMTLRGDFQRVVETLYPRFRQRAAKKLGGNERLVAQMQKMVNDFAAQGIMVTKFEAEPALHGFDVPEFREWLVFVPTTKTVRFVDPQTGLKQVKAVSDYQVAIRGKADGSQWSFLNGSTLKIQELRALFPTLPADIEEWAVPRKSARDVK
jgi:hypothetical protein